MRLTLAIIVLVIVATACACGGPAATTTTETAGSYSPQEAAVIDFCERHYEQLASMVNGTSDVVEGGNYERSYMIGALQPVADTYKDVCAEYNSVNGGETTGGRVTRLEKLWEACGNSVRAVNIELINLLADPATFRPKRAAYYYVMAKETLALVRQELDRLEGI